MYGVQRRFVCFWKFSGTQNLPYLQYTLFCSKTTILNTCLTCSKLFHLLESISNADTMCAKYGSRMLLHTTSIRFLFTCSHTANYLDNNQPCQKRNLDLLSNPDHSLIIPLQYLAQTCNTAGTCVYVCCPTATHRSQDQPAKQKQLTLRKKALCN